MRSWDTSCGVLDCRDPSPECEDWKVFLLSLKTKIDILQTNLRGILRLIYENVVCCILCWLIASDRYKPVYDWQWYILYLLMFSLWNCCELKLRYCHCITLKPEVEIVNHLGRDCRPARLLFFSISTCHIKFIIVNYTNNCKRCNLQHL